MKHLYIYTSLTRISDLDETGFVLKKLPREQWQTGDYVVCEIIDPGSSELKLELANGRMRGIMGGELLVGALGERFATLEATGTWRKVGEDLKMTVLTGAGLLGKLTSKSAYMPNLIEVVYTGHTFRYGEKLTMNSFVRPEAYVPFTTPVILFVGTSMSAGKTTSARIVTNLFKLAGHKVVGAKLTGAGRFKDILAIKDVGADEVLDFVDVGLPSSICPREEYQEKLAQLLSKIEKVKADVAILEIGASPLEPYNGDIAINAIRDQIKCIILSASDPYAVHGLMKVFDIVPDIVTGVATNTLAGCKMVETLCKVKALNLIDATTTPFLKNILSSATELDLEHRFSETEPKTFHAHIDFVHTNRDENLEQVVSGKLNHLFTKYKGLIKAHVIIEEEKDSTSKGKICKIEVSAPGPRIFASSNETTFEASVAETIRDLDRQLLKRKEKMNLHH
jgi:ribosome-associated translation inhibitor RaiA